MKPAKFQILLITHGERLYTQILHDLLTESGYEFVHFSHVGTGIEKATELIPDLIICQHEMEDHNGFKVYNALQPVLEKNNIPFMLILKEFKKDVVLIGLELGIDNFIIQPFDELALLNKIEKQIIKVKKRNVLESEEFEHLFENTPIARFILEEDRIKKINRIFSELTGIRKDLKSFPKLTEIFNFSENETNELNFQKCLNGLRKCCLFKSLKLNSGNPSGFDIHMIQNNFLGENLYACELVPTGFSMKSTMDNSGGLAVKDKNDEKVTKASIPELTRREKEVLHLSANGLSIKQIANELGISARTVEKHRSNIMEKSGTTNIIESILIFRNI